MNWTERYSIYTLEVHDSFKLQVAWDSGKWHVSVGSRRMPETYGEAEDAKRAAVAYARMVLQEALDRLSSR